MVIAYIHDNFSFAGGIEKILTDKLQYLCENTSITVYLITYKSEADFRSFFPLPDRLNIIFLNLDPMSPKFKKNYKRKTEESLIEKKVDISICIMYTVPFYFLFKCRDHSKKIAEFHTSYEYVRGFTNIRQNIRTYLEERYHLYKFINTAKKYSRFVVLSNTDNEKWIRHLKNTVVIPNFITLKNSLPIDYSQKKAISVGRLNGVKDFPLLIKTWALVVEKHPEWQLSIYGEGDMREQLQEMILDFGLQQNVILHKPVKDLRPTYKASSLFLFSSRFEGFGLVLVEAMASGLPVINVDMKGGGAEINIDNKTGLYVKSRTPVIFAEKISYAIKHPELREVWGQNGIQKSADFHPDLVMKIWLNLFSEVLKG